MSSKEPTPINTAAASASASTDSFVDAPESADAIETVEVDDKDTLKEEPLATPNHSLIQSNGSEENQPEESEKKTDVVTIFDVATEIENMLKEIDSKIDENDQLVQQKIEKINKTLDKIENKMRNNK
ncbi:hypothetical protein WICANDRAFT_78028 [Wickerhamomyces anomalus NRRL Y-366-8]|uniref:Uncharacterized protein n=1 Tax=Wickerhamomyces anomalus (strain ATCC 58044 / CBS 1984 / NCYC 433 / NRRL Y-366-8) TaxID=683960 RepID=A0A1E3P944_WICAA|nr:uncharacterized protein WICANDRAFT_78028 [Wickerhamomyces anomalus NRRL Y-366-8]ODQ61397.1 hypothetical protein WICANDRAFT_78028 [Wickerhamomyces anomalus NRRL Y-366-8]